MQDEANGDDEEYINEIILANELSKKKLYMMPIYENSAIMCYCVVLSGDEYDCSGDRKNRVSSPC